MPILLEREAQSRKGLVSQVESWVVAVNRAIAAFAMAAVFVIVFFNVIGRYGFGRSFARIE